MAISQHTHFCHSIPSSLVLTIHIFLGNHHLPKEPAPGSQLWLQPWLPLSGVSHEVVMPSGEAKTIALPWICLSLADPGPSSLAEPLCWSCVLGRGSWTHPAPPGCLCWGVSPAEIPAERSLCNEVALWQHENHIKFYRFPRERRAYSKMPIMFSNDKRKVVSAHSGQKYLAKTSR